jgi:hypothetical protein
MGSKAACPDRSLPMTLLGTDDVALIGVCRTATKGRVQ